MVSLRFVFFVIYLTLQLSPSLAFATDKKVASKSNSESLLVMYSTQKVQIETLKEQQRFAQEKVSSELAQIEQELSELKGDSLKHEHQIELMHSTFNQRVDDALTNAGQDIDRFSVLLTAFALITTVLFTLVGFIGTRKAVADAKSEAETATELWFEKYATNLQEKISDLEKKSLDAINHIENEKNKVSQVSQEAQLKINQRIIPSDDKPSEPLSDDIRRRAEGLSTQLSQKFTFNDWNTLAHAAADKNELSEAAFCWSKAWEDESAEKTDRGIVLFNRALAESKLLQSEQAIQTYDALIAYVGEDKAPTLRELVAQAIFNKGFRQGLLNRPEQAIQTYDALIAYVGADQTPALRELVAQAMVNKGITQVQLNQSAKAIQTYEALIAYVGEDTAPALRVLVAKAMVSKGITQGQLNQSEQAIQTYDALISYVGEDKAPALRVLVVQAMVNKGVMQGQLYQSEQEIQTYNALIAYVGADQTPALREMVAQAMVNKGVTLVQLDQPEQSILTSEALIAYVGADQTPALRELVAQAMVNKGDAQGRLNQSGQKIKTYEALISYVGADQAPALREWVANANNGIGFTLLCDCKQLIQKGDIAEANNLLNQALEKLELAIQEKASGAFIGNKAYALALLGQHDESERIFAQALCAEVHGGESLYQATLKDFDIYPIPQDDAFRAIVERQWAIYLQERKGEKETFRS